MRTEEATPGNVEDDLDADVVIVGYGPVGQTLAALLGRSGHRVVVCERRSGRYDTPRAGHFDHEIMRVFQQLGIADEVLRVADAARLYEFLDPDGSVVSRLPRDWAAPSGWDASYHFYQPELEDVLDDVVRRQPSVDVRFESNVVGIRRHPGRVVVELDDGRTVAGRYVVGADGAHSAVRSLSGIGTQDLGFEADWLVVDVKPVAGAPDIDIPDTGQVLNPARPSHMGRVSQRYFRWEFMLVDGDDPSEITAPDRIWQLLAPWIDPSRGTLIRQTVYTFRSIVADTFRDGSVLLAGDAAHLMPPFLGQGMCSGIRDAATLGWMLDLVLNGTARDGLLDDYTAARRSHVLAYIEESVRIGTVVCETDPVLAAERRTTLAASTEIPPPFEPPIGAGFRAGDVLAGGLAVQPVLAAGDGTTGLSDDVLGTGFTLFCVAEPDAETSSSIAQLQSEIDLRVGILGSGGLAEVGVALADWFAEAGVVAAVVRPDFYVFGTAATVQDVPGLLGDLRASLSLV